MEVEEAVDDFAVVVDLVELLLEVCMVCVNRQEKGPTHCGPRVRPSGPVSNNLVVMRHTSLQHPILVFHGQHDLKIVFVILTLRGRR